MASIHFVCPVCAQNLKVSATLAGRKGRCPFCSAKVRIPVDDNGSAEVLDPGKKQDASDIASAPELSDAEAQAAIGPSVMMHPDSAPSGMAADPAQLGQPPGTGAPVAGGNDLQSQLDRELAGAGAPVPEHAHDSEAATVRWTAGAGPVIQAETTQPGSVPPMKIIRLQPNATDVSAAAELPQILPKAPREVPTPPPAEATASAPPSAPMMPKVETIKYGPDSNPARQSGEQRIGAVPTSSSADRFVETRHGATPARTEPPPAAAPTVSPDLPGDLPAPSGSVHAAPPSGGVHSTSSGPAAIPPVPVDLPDAPSAVLPPIATHANSLDDFFNEGSENKVGDGLASLPKERTRPTSAVGALAARTQTPNPPQVAVAPVASMQTPATPVYAHGSSTAGSLIGDRCDPSRHGQSATPVILWVALVLLTLGGLTAWLVVNGLNRRTASIQASQAFLRLTDLAAAEGEYFNAPRTTVAGPTALASAPATAVSEKSGNEYAATIAALEEKKLLTPALWKDGVTLLDTPEKPVVGSKTDPKPAGMRLAEANGYRYVLWHTRLSTAQPAINFYSKDPAHLDRGFAVAAIPTDSANWAYAIDDRGRLIQWRYTPPAAGQKSAAIPPGGPSDPVETACYPSDSDFDKIPIR